MLSKAKLPFDLPAAAATEGVLWQWQRCEGPSREPLHGSRGAFKTRLRAEANALSHHLEA